MKFILTLLFATFVSAQAEWPLAIAELSEEEEKESEAVVGIIKLIYMDEENNRLRLRLKTSDENDSSEEFAVCNPEQSNKEIKLIRQAFAKGALVRVVLSGSFNHCLSHVQYVDSHGDLKQVGI